MRSARQFHPAILAFVLLLMLRITAPAFSLLGPFPPWISREYLEILGYYGGPMEIDQGYRWNVPLVTYGFTPEFVEFFGTNGVAAVEAAAAKLNALPPASQIDVTNFLNNPVFFNQTALDQSLLNLESYALGIFLNGSGVGPGDLFMFNVYGRFPTNTFNPFGDNADAYPVAIRNYDPITLEPSEAFGGNRYTYNFYSYGFLPHIILHSMPVNPVVIAAIPASAPGMVGMGFLTSLPREEVAALRYLLHPTNRKTEPLLSDVIPWPPIVMVAGIPVPASLVSVAQRPGLDKVEFVRFDPGTNLFGRVFADRYFSGGTLHTQTVARVLSRPDIVFDAKDLGFRREDLRSLPQLFRRFYAEFPKVSGTNIWINCSSLNNSTNGEGPGIIQPGLTVTFNTVAAYAQTNFYTFNLPPIDFYGLIVGRFDDSTNPPTRLGAKTNLPPRALYLDVIPTNGFSRTEWGLIGKVNAIYHIETSTNLTDWTLLQTVTNSNTLFQITLTNSLDAQFLRLREN